MHRQTLMLHEGPFEFSPTGKRTEGFFKTVPTRRATASKSSPTQSSFRVSAKFDQAVS